VDGTPDVEKADQYCFDLDFDMRGFFDLGEFFDLPSMDRHLASGSYR
jgi:hypothetical protein